MIHFMALASVAVGLFAFAFGDYGDEELEVQKEIKSGAKIFNGVLCMVISQLLYACKSVIEEFILKKVNAGGQEPCYMMGWQGVWGICFTLLFFGIVSTIGCPFEEENCVNGHIDDFS